MSEQVSQEKLTWADENTDMHWAQRYLAKALHMTLDVRSLTFDMSDVKEKEVEALSQYPDHLEAVAEWIVSADRNMTKTLQAVRRDLISHLSGWKYPTFYRGFHLRGSQIMMGFSKQRWWGPSPTQLKPGDRFSFIPESPLSFTHVKGVADTFGSIVVRIPGRANYHRMLPLTPSLVWASDHLTWRDKEFFKGMKHHNTEAETILLPDGKPLEFIVESVRK